MIDKLEEFSSFCEFINDINLFLGFKDLVELDDVRVANFAEYLELAENTLLVVLILDFSFVKDFDCNSLGGNDMNALLDFGEGATAYGTTQHVVADLEPVLVVLHQFKGL